MRRPDDDAKQWGMFGYESSQDARLRNHRSGTVDFHFWHSIAPTCSPIPGQRLSRAGFRVDAQLDGIWPLPHERCLEASTNFAASICWDHHNLFYAPSIGKSRLTGLTTRWRRARKAARLHASCHDRRVTSERAAIYYANLLRELFVLEQIVEGQDDDPPSFEDLKAQVMQLPQGEVSAVIDKVQYTEIPLIRKAHRITRWIDADGRHRSTPRDWPSPDNEVRR